MRSEERRAWLGLERADFAPSVRALVVGGSIRSAGTKRATRYFPSRRNVDEDWDSPHRETARSLAQMPVPPSERFKARGDET